MPNLAIEQVSYMEEDNMWIGPRQVRAFINGGIQNSCCLVSIYSHKIFRSIEALENL